MWIIARYDDEGARNKIKESPDEMYDLFPLSQENPIIENS